MGPVELCIRYNTSTPHPGSNFVLCGSGKVSKSGLEPVVVLQFQFLALKAALLRSSWETLGKGARRCIHLTHAMME